MHREEIEDIIVQFQDLSPNLEIETLTSGHINNSFKVRNGKNLLVLQKINPAVFPRPVILMQNIQKVAQHLKAQDYPYTILQPLRSKSGTLLVHKTWRLFPFISDSSTYAKAQSPEQVYAAAYFLGNFHTFLKDLNPQELGEPLPGFLDFNWRFNQFNRALTSGIEERKIRAQKEIAYLNAQQHLLKQWQQIVTKLPQRIIHADPKISNFLFEKGNAKKIKALIDWDTIQPGNILYDFGDMVRSYTNLEDEHNSENENNFSFKNYLALKEGFKDSYASYLTQIELENMDLAGSTIIYIQALRFLTDYLQGDRYYHIQYSEQNLHRTRNQIHLLQGLQKFTQSR